MFGHPLRIPYPYLGTLWAQAPSTEDPSRIPEEEEGLRPVPRPGQVCEPLVFEKLDLAKKIFPLLPQELRDHYAKVSKEKGKTIFGVLAWDLGARHRDGGLNSPEQRIRTRFYNKDTKRYKTTSAPDWDHITRAEAARFLVGYREYRGGGFGVKHTALASALATYTPKGHSRPILESIFFPHAPLDGSARRATKVVSLAPAIITDVSDGDTIKVIIKRKACLDEVVIIRFAGIDTPEKFRSASKFWPQAGAIMNLLKEKGWIRKEEMELKGEIATLLANRMQYAGEISSLIMRDFLFWSSTQGASYSLEETYNRVQREGDDPAVCDMVTMYGKYLRGVWVARVNQTGLIPKYIDMRLAQLMDRGGNYWWENKTDRRPSADTDRTAVKLWASHVKYALRNRGGKLITNGTDLWRHHQLDWLISNSSRETKKRYLAAQKKLEELRRTGRNKLADLLDPAKIPEPRQLYSKKMVEKISSEYRRLLSRRPDRAGDLNLAMVAMGASYVYTKYRNNLTGTYLKIGNRIQRLKLGLWGEKTVRLLDVNRRGVDKERHRFIPYTMPKDCTTSR